MWCWSHVLSEVVSVSLFLFFCVFHSLRSLCVCFCSFWLLNEIRNRCFCHIPQTNLFIKFLFCKRSVFQFCWVFFYHNDVALNNENRFCLSIIDFEMNGVEFWVRFRRGRRLMMLWLCFVNTRAGGHSKIDCTSSAVCFVASFHLLSSVLTFLSSVFLLLPNWLNSPKEDAISTVAILIDLVLYFKLLNHFNLI